MPCNSDYLNPTYKEREIQLTAKLIVYVDKKQGQPSPRWIKSLANNIYADNDKVVPILCDMIKNMSDEERERIVYDAHDPVSRDLANWWESHQRADARRLEQEAEQREAERRKEAALAKLTPEDRKALGIE